MTETNPKAEVQRNIYHFIEFITLEISLAYNFKLEEKSALWEHLHQQHNGEDQKLISAANELVMSIVTNHMWEVVEGRKGVVYVLLWLIKQRQKPLLVCILWILDKDIF
ncbi:hypothetical protein [Escherichia coli]|uniref:hypothetical protein n=1 Tax=Escherichia coli TaxID=562 RepID=UPI003F77831F